MPILKIFLIKNLIDSSQFGQDFMYFVTMSHLVEWNANKKQKSLLQDELLSIPTHFGKMYEIWGL